MIDKLKEYFQTTSVEQQKEDWDEVKKLNLGGPTLTEFINSFNKPSMKYRIYYEDGSHCDFPLTDDIMYVWLNLNEPYVKLSSLNEDGTEIETFTKIV